MVRNIGRGITMIRCNDCGHEFESPRIMRESHGEELEHCPNCLSTEIFDLKWYECGACDGYVEHKDDSWCPDCVIETKRAMERAILKAVRATDLNFSTVVNAIEDLMNEHPIESMAEKYVAYNLMLSIVDLADDRGCSFHTAFDMVNDWAEGRM